MCVCFPLPSEGILEQEKLYCLVRLGVRNLSVPKVLSLWTWYLAYRAASLTFTRKYINLNAIRLPIFFIFEGMLKVCCKYIGLGVGCGIYLMFSNTWDVKKTCLQLPEHCSIMKYPLILIGIPRLWIALTSWNFKAFELAVGSVDFRDVCTAFYNIGVGL